MSDQNAELLSSLLTASDDELFEGIGAAESEEIGVRLDVKKLIQLGKKWWSENEAKLRSVVCENVAVRHLASGPTLDVAQATYVALLSECQAELRVYACVLIVKAGVSTWCEPMWKKS